MRLKSIILTSSGLKNIIFKEEEEKEFSFIIGNEKIKMSQVLAQFISPIVSHLHHCDPTINSYSINEIIEKESDDLISGSREQFVKTVISFLRLITSCNYININPSDIYNMIIISIILGNEELYEKIEKISRDEYGEDGDIIT